MCGALLSLGAPGGCRCRAPRLLGLGAAAGAARGVDLVSLGARGVLEEHSADGDE